MPNLTQLRIAAREIFDEALRALDVGGSMHQAVRISGSRLDVCGRALELDGRKVYSIAIGKAAAPMAYALEQQLGEYFAGGFLSGPIPRSEVLGLKGLHEWKLRTRWRWVQGGHPLPTRSSLFAAKEAFTLLERANAERAIVIFLVSGGGSAMIEWPIRDDITCSALRAANKALVNSGASIREINSVRRAFSAIKGGRLAARASDCEQITLIVSDVPSGDERNVASGPTLAPPADAPKPLDVIARYGLRSQLPATVIRAIDAGSEPFEECNADYNEHFVLLDNNDALEAAAAAARRRGFITEIATEISDQPIAEGCRRLLERMAALRAKQPLNSAGVCLISGGEFACPVMGDGIGGRNLETALRLACSTNSSLSDTVALCAGTDGIDGNSPAAGALVDSTTIERATRIGLDAQSFLQRSDAYSFFVALGDAITTGVTGTNVRDLRILISA